MSLSVSQFVRRWKLNALTERAGAQSHFIDLCEMLGQPHPAAADAVGERYTFEKPVPKTYGGKGFADVWLRDHFAWEYKGKHKDLDIAYRQLNDYREELGNPPLLVVCDMDRFKIHTNFTSTQKRIFEFNLSDLEKNQVTATCPLPPLEVLRALFGDTNALRPNRTDAYVTQEAAKAFARLAERLEIEKRSLTDTPIHTREEIAHFLMRLLFCLFADSIGLLPNSLFKRLVQSEDRFLPRKFLRKLKNLFQAMSVKDSDFGEYTIKYFNGGLFDSSSIIELDTTDLGILYEVTSNYNWAHIAPEIFGTLFERSLNAERRSLIGAHYTSAEDILLLIEPVLMQPLERRWAEVQANILSVLSANGAASSQPGAQPQETSFEGDGLQPVHREAKKKGASAPEGRHSLLRSNPQAEAMLSAWIDELTGVRVLDPACGSGNFLYLALRRLLDLWLEAQRFAAANDISMVVPKMVSPSQLYGIETEFYAHELASIVVWIGYLQWKHEHGIADDREPILEKLNNIEHGDAILRYDADSRPYEPEWPQADYIIGNPPFLGGSKMRREMKTEEHPEYVDDLRRQYAGKIPAGADLVTYWFEKARSEIIRNNRVRAGLIATQAIRAGSNREVLKAIKTTGDIFMAWSDRPWVLEGADVRVSLIAFDSGREDQRTLDGKSVTVIHANLAEGLALASALPLNENSGWGFKGLEKNGPFELSQDIGRKMLAAPLNPNGRPNSDVVFPWVNHHDIAGRNRGMFVIDFGTELSKEDASLYELPFEWVRSYVLPARTENSDPQRRERWWRFGRSGKDLRRAVLGLNRFIATGRVSKHRAFVWIHGQTVPDSRLFIIASDEDYHFGLLQSIVHERWALATSSRHGIGNDPTYNGESCFDTFPFPYLPGTEPSEADSPIVRAIADAARELVHLRDNWLNPKDAAGHPLPESELKDRTLTKLYNARPEWLSNAHRTLDEAVFNAYGWPSNLSDQDILTRLLTLNHERAAQTA